MITITDTIQLQNIQIGHYSKLKALIERIYPPAYKHLWVNEDCSFYINKFFSIENFKLELSDTNAEYYFVIYKSNIVGIFRFVYNTNFDNFPETNSTYINRIYLQEATHGKGVAQNLFRWVEEKVMQKNNTLIWLKAMDSQNQALRFYEKHNYSYGKPTQLDFELIHPNLRGMHTMYKFLG